MLVIAPFDPFEPSSTASVDEPVTFTFEALHTLFIHIVRFKPWLSIDMFSSKQFQDVATQIGLSFTKPTALFYYSACCCVFQNISVM